MKHLTILSDHHRKKITPYHQETWGTQAKQPTTDPTHSVYTIDIHCGSHLLLISRRYGTVKLLDNKETSRWPRGQTGREISSWLKSSEQKSKFYIAGKTILSVHHLNTINTTYNRRMRAIRSEENSSQKISFRGQYNIYSETIKSEDTQCGINIKNGHIILKKRKL